jgi:hypothetical protein
MGDCITDDWAEQALGCVTAFGLYSACSLNWPQGSSSSETCAGGLISLPANCPFLCARLLNGARILRNPKDTLHATGYPACDPANCTTHRAADGTSRSVTHGRPFLSTTNDALRLNGHGDH